MKWIGRGLLVALALFTAGSSTAGPGGCTNAPSLTPFAFEEISVSTTAIGFTSGTAFPLGEKGADYVVFDIEDDAIRVRDDGLAPTATVGSLLPVNTTWEVCGESAIRKTRFIRVTTDADVNVRFYREGGQ